MDLPVFDDSLDAAEIERMMNNAQRATEFLKALAHEGRLMILCHLASEGECSVTELENLLGQRQPVRSQDQRRQSEQKNGEPPTIRPVSTVDSFRKTRPGRNYRV